MNKYARAYEAGQNDAFEKFALNATMRYLQSKGIQSANMNPGRINPKRNPGDVAMLRQAKQDAMASVLPPGANVTPAQPIPHNTGRKPPVAAAGAPAAAAGAPAGATPNWWQGVKDDWSKNKGNYMLGAGLTVGLPMALNMFSGNRAPQDSNV